MVWYACAGGYADWPNICLLNLNSNIYASFVIKLIFTMKDMLRMDSGRQSHVVWNQNRNSSSSSAADTCNTKYKGNIKTVEIYCCSKKNSRMNTRAIAATNSWTLATTVDLTIAHKFSINTNAMKSPFIKFKIVSSQNNDNKCHIGNMQISPNFSKCNLDYL